MEVFEIIKKTGELEYKVNRLKSRTSQRREKQNEITEKWMPVLEAGDSLDKRNYDQAAQMFETMQNYFDENLPLELDKACKSHMRPTILVPTFRRLIAEVNNFKYVNQEIPFVKIGKIDDFEPKDTKGWMGVSIDSETVNVLTHYLIEKFGKNIIIGKNPITYKGEVLYVAITCNKV